MAKIRIFQIAKELNISHTDIVSFLKSKKVQVSSHMSPVEENIRKMIMDEFAKDKEQVDRFRKERVRREIHDTRLKEQQQSTKKLKPWILMDFPVCSGLSNNCYAVDSPVCCGFSNGLSWIFSWVL